MRKKKYQKYHKDFIHFSMYVTCLLSSSTQKTLIPYCQSTSLKEVKDIRQLLAILRNNASSRSRTKQYECLLLSEHIGFTKKYSSTRRASKVEEVNRHSFCEIL